MQVDARGADGPQSQNSLSMNFRLIICSPFSYHLTWDGQRKGKA